MRPPAPGTNPGLAFQDVNAAQRQEEVDFALLGSLFRGVFIRSLDKGESDVAVYTASKVPHNIGAVGEKRAGGQVIRCLGLSCSSRVPAERKNGPNYPSNPSEKTAGLALCLKPPVQKVVFSVGPSSCY